MDDNSTDARPRSEKHPRRGNGDGLTLDDGSLVEQPANQQPAAGQGSHAGEEFANGDRGQVAGRMQELDAAVGGKPGQSR